MQSTVTDPRRRQLMAWVETLPPGVYRSSDLRARFQALFPADDLAPNVFGCILRQLGAALFKVGGVRRVQLFDAPTMSGRAAAVSRVDAARRAPLASSLRNPREGRTVSVHLTDPQSAWVNAAARRQGNTEAAIVRFALAAAMAADGVR
jgi:hypothetical protein